MVFVLFYFYPNCSNLDWVIVFLVGYVSDFTIVKLRIRSDEFHRRRRVLWLGDDAERCSCYFSWVDVLFAPISVRDPRDQSSHSRLLCHLRTWHSQLSPLGSDNHPIPMFLHFSMLFLLLHSLFICNLIFVSSLCDLRLQRMLLSVGFCLSKLTLVPRLISTMVCVQRHLLARFDLRSLIFNWPIWRILLQDSSMVFMGPKLLSFLQIRMGYGKSLKFGSAKSFFCLLKDPDFFMFLFFLSFLRFWFTTTVTWPVLIVALLYWKLLAMNYPTMILKQSCLLWGTFNSLMEGIVLKLGLDPWPLRLCNAENVKFTAVFQFGWIWCHRLMSRFMPLWYTLVELLLVLFPYLSDLCWQFHSHSYWRRNWS